MFNLIRSDFFLIMSFVAMSGCSTNMFEMKGHDEAEVVKIFAKYRNRALSSETFDQTVEGFFPPKIISQIKSTKGWSRLVYSSAFLALKDGECAKLELHSMNHNNVYLDCVGPYKVFSFFLGESEEMMHLRVYFINIEGKWYLNRSGFVHTQDGSTGAYNKKGIKFSPILI